MRLLVLLFLWAPFPGLSQFTPANLSRKFLYAGNLSEQGIDGFSVIEYPALAPSLKTTSIGFATEQRFAIKDLKSVSAVFAMPARHAGIAVGLDYYSNKTYHDGAATIAYAKMLAAKVSVALQCCYRRSVFTGYETVAGIGAGCSAIFRMTGQFLVGVKWNHIAGIQNKINSNTYETSITYDLSANCETYASISKTERSPGEMIFGVCYSLADLACFKAAIATRQAESFFSAGLQNHNIHIAISIAHHPQLGFTPGLFLSFDIKQVKTADEK